MAVKTETRVIKIDVNATQAAKATKRLNAHMKRLNRSATSVTESIFRFQMGMQALASFLAIREIADLADKYTILHGRLKLVIKSQEDMIIVQRDLNALASDVFTDVGSVAKAYTDLQLKIKGVRLSHEDTIKVVRTMAQSFRVSGSTAKEASSATLQLMQALSSGKLQGDELRTLRESNILLLDAIVEQYRRVNKIQKDAKLNIKELGAEGKITPEIILDALKRSAPKFEAQAKKLSITFENIFVVARNKLAAFLGDLEAKGTLKPLKDGLLGVAKAADSAAVAFGSFVALFVAAKVLTGIKATAAALMSLRVALSTGGLAAITVAMGALIGYVYELGKGVTDINGKLYKNMDLWRNLVKIIGLDVVKTFENFTDTIITSIEKTVGITPSVSGYFSFILDVIPNIFFSILDVFKSAFSLTEKYFDMLFGSLKDLWQIFQQIKKGEFFDAGLGAIITTFTNRKRYDDAMAETDKFANELPKRIKKRFMEDRFFTELFKDGYKEISTTFEKQLEKVRGALGNYYKKAHAQAVQNTKAISEENKKVTTTMLDDVKTKVENTNSFIKDGLTNYINDIKDWGKQVTDMANKTMKSFEDAIVKAVTTGKLQFKDLADSILQDLARIMVRQHISGPIAQALAASFSPTAPTNQPSTPSVQPPTTGIPNVAVMPPVFDGALPPFMESPGFGQMSSMRPSISAPRIMVPQQKTNVSIQNFSGQQAQVSETVSADGSKNIKVTIGQVVKEGLAAGQYDRVLSGAFGINRKGSR